LSELKGFIIILNFWVIDCSSCIDYISLLNQLTEEYDGENVVFLSFTTDSKEAILNFKKDHELKYVVFDESRDLIQNTFHLPYGYPTNIILDKDGKVVKVKLGGDLKKMKSVFKEIIDVELAR